MKLLIALALTAILSTNGMAISKFTIEPDNCENWLAQAMYNNKKIYEKGTNPQQDTAQYETGMLAFMSYQACVNKEQAIRLNKKLEVMTRELQMIKSVLITQNEIKESAPTGDTSIPPAFDSSMGDYQ